jgi:hypothetical protein
MNSHQAEMLVEAICPPDTTKSIKEQFGKFVKNTDSWLTDPILNERFMPIAMRVFGKISNEFTKEINMKADIFSLAYIIAVFNKNIQYTDNNQKVFIDYIYNRCIEGNPYQRITVNELYNELNQQLNRINQPSVSQQGGKLLKQTSCDKVPSKFYGYDTPSL